MKLGLASPDLGSFLSLRDAAHGRRDGRVHGHEAGGARVREARHVERAPAVEAVPPAHWGWPTARHTKFCQKCCKNSIKFGPFSAVSAPIFASKYSLENIFRDLQVLHTFAPLKIQNCRKLLFSVIFTDLRQLFEKRVFTCKDRCRYSRKRAKFC